MEGVFSAVVSSKLLSANPVLEEQVGDALEMFGVVCYQNVFAG